MPNTKVYSIQPQMDYDITQKTQQYEALAKGQAPAQIDMSIKAIAVVKPEPPKEIFP